MFPKVENEAQVYFGHAVHRKLRKDCDIRNNKWKMK